MTRKTIFLFASLLALLLSANAFAGGSTPQSSGLPMPGLSVGISGCESSGTGDWNCVATVHGGSGSYNFWWQHSGSGQPYQTNSSSISITGCVDGFFTLKVNIMDHVTRLKAQSSTFTCACDDGFGEFESPF